VTKIRILLIEDNRILREGIMAMLEKRGDFSVAAVSDGREASLIRVRATKPALALLDLGLRTQDSVEAVGTVKRVFPGVRIIGMGLVPAQSDIMEFVQAGAHGFILKSATVEEVVGTIRAVARGETVLPSTMTGSLFSQVVEHALAKGKRNLKNAARMTRREKEVISGIVDGMSNKQIAGRLGIATFTVKSHVHNIMEKLALHSRLQIARHAAGDAES
jgi:two-component system, NarL family, nitrate/nitrite response regulator NarL